MKSGPCPEDPNAESAIALITQARRKAGRDQLITLPGRDHEGFWFANAVRLTWHPVMILICIVGMAAGCQSKEDKYKDASLYFGEKATDAVLLEGTGETVKENQFYHDEYIRYTDSEQLYMRKYQAEALVNLKKEFLK